MDAASQSLADALRASFGILKVIMAVLFILYVFSNVRRIQGHEEALRLRLGQLRPGVEQPGLVWALPFPIDEIVPLPTRKSNDLLIDSHTFRRNENEVGKPLSFISRGESEGLKPAIDGALITADAGLVHVQWKVTYKIEDVAGYVSQVSGREIEAAEGLIKALVETAGIHVASELTAEEAIRTKVDAVQIDMKRLVNERLTALNSGITVTRVELFEPTPPMQVRKAFDATQVAENFKQKHIRDAEQERTKILNEAAGAVHGRLLELLDEIDRAKAANQPHEEELAELDRMLESEVEGEAGKRIKDAGSYLSTVVGQMQSDVELYRTLLPEFERNPALLVARLWEQTKNEIFEQPGVSKFYRPGQSQIRLHIPLDPDETRLQEERRVRETEFDASKLKKTKWVPVGPEMD